jgi:hypothetical protein
MDIRMTKLSGGGGGGGGVGVGCEELRDRRACTHELLRQYLYFCTRKASKLNKEVPGSHDSISTLFCTSKASTFVLVTQVN